jgi:hypothetical protein
MILKYNIQINMLLKKPEMCHTRRNCLQRRFVDVGLDQMLEDR